MLWCALCGLLLLGGLLSAHSGAHGDTPAAFSAGSEARGGDDEASLRFSGLFASVQALGKAGLQDAMPGGLDLGTRSSGAAVSSRGGAAAERPDPTRSLLVLGGLGLACLLVMGRKSSRAETEGDRPWLLAEFSEWKKEPGGAESATESAARGRRALEGKPPAA